MSDITNRPPWDEALTSLENSGEGYERHCREIRAEIARLREENDRLREDLANLDHAILSKIDPGAAGSTDLYTWAKCKTAEIAKLREENERLRDDLAEAVSILYECSTLSAHYDQTRKRLRSFLRRQDPDA